MLDVNLTTSIQSRGSYNLDSISHPDSFFQNKLSFSEDFGDFSEWQRSCEEIASHIPNNVCSRDDSNNFQTNVHDKVSAATHSNNSRKNKHICETVLNNNVHNKEFLQNINSINSGKILHSNSLTTNSCDSSMINCHDNRKVLLNTNFLSHSYVPVNNNNQHTNGKILNGNDCHSIGSVLPPQNEISCQQTASSSMCVGSKGSSQQVAFSQKEASITVTASKNQLQKDNTFQVENQHNLNYNLTASLSFSSPQTKPLTSDQYIEPIKQIKLKKSFQVLNQQGKLQKSNSFQLSKRQALESNYPSYTTLQKSSLTSVGQTVCFNNTSSSISTSSTQLYSSNHPTTSTYQGNHTLAAEYPPKKFDQLMESGPSGLNNELTMATTMQNPFDVPSFQSGSLGISQNSEGQSIFIYV